MGSMLTFDDLEQVGTQENKPDKPLWCIDLDKKENEKQILAWCNGEYQNLMHLNSQRFTKARKNLMLYKGMQYFAQQKRDADAQRERKRYRQIDKKVFNHLFDMVQQRIARLIEYKPAVAWHPTNDDYSDKIAAEMMSMFCEHIWYVNQFEDEIVPEIVTWSKTMGEAYCFQIWDIFGGKVHPKFAAAEKLKQEIPLLDEKGQQLLDKDGQPRFIKDAVHVGEIRYDQEYTFNVLPQRKLRWRDVDYVFRTELMHIEEAKLLYKDADPEIFKPMQNNKVWDYDAMEFREAKNEVAIKTLYYRECKGLKKGRVIVFTEHGIAENVEYFEKTGLKNELPCERLIDFKNPLEAHGSSYIDHIKGPAAIYNNLTNMIVRNQYLVSHPKWMMPSGAANLEELGNDITIVQFKGAVAPQLVQANPTPQEVFNFRREVKTDMEQIGAVYGVSRGNPPPGIDAAIALQFLEEQETKRANPDYVIFNAFIKRNALKSQKIAGSKYEPEDERTVGVLGKYDRWMSERLNLTNFQKDYDVRVANSSALPRTKSARIQTLVFLQKNYPNAIPQEQVVDMLDLGQPGRFTDAVTVAVRAAEMENDDMMSMRPVKEPGEFENHIQHWKIHSRIPQEYFFKKQLPPEAQKAFMEHIMATEYLMWEKAKIHPGFMQQILALPNYPMYFKPDQPVQVAATPVGGEMPEIPGDAGADPGPVAREPDLSADPSQSPEQGEVVRPTRLVGQNPPAIG